MLSALEANHLHEDSVVHCAELGEVFRTESPRNISVQQSLNHVGLHHAIFHTSRGRLSIIQLRSEPFEACPHETSAPFDFEREISVFVEYAAEV